MQLIKIFENGHFMNQYDVFWQDLRLRISNSNFHASRYFSSDEIFDLKNHHRIDVLFDDTMNVIGMSGVYSHPTWPNRVFRTHSRLWFDGNEISDIIPKFLIGPVHNEIKLIADALFVSFNGSIEENIVDKFLHYHTTLWQDNLQWVKQTNINIPHNLGTTVLYANIKPNFNFLQNF